MKYSQQGIGLVEVMVALMLLAIAVLGFTVMQMTAVKATDESLMRTRALAVMRSGAEMMRANTDGVTDFKNALNGTSTSVGGISSTSCTPSGNPKTCNVRQLAIRDALVLKNYARENEIRIGADVCPGTDVGQIRQCLIASWGETQPIFDDDKTKKPCANASDGAYYPQAQCFIMEAY